ncbi:hypothetical protein ACOMHN_044365 [Nucella lapillus]
MESVSLAALTNGSKPTESNGTEDNRMEYTLLPLISKYIVYVGLPLIIILGNFGNVMTIVIMRKMTSSGKSIINIYFTAIAAVDLLVLYVHGLDFWVGRVTNIFARAQSSVSCKLLMWLYAASATTSCWLLVCMTVHRAMSVVWPHKVNVMCTKRTVFVVIDVIVLFCSAFYSHNIVGMDMSDLDNDTYYMCWTKSEEHLYFIQNIFVYMELSVYCLLPFTCLVIANGVLVRKLSVSVKKARADLTHKNSHQVLAREKAANSVTLTVVVVSVTFMVLTLPISVYFMVFNSADLQFQYDWSDQMKIQAFFDLSSVLANANSAVNFYLYCLTGRRFREEFLKIMCCGRNRQQREASSG